MILSDAFLKELGDLELAPPAYNSAVFIQASGWNLKKYSNAFFEDDANFPVLVIMSDTDGIMYWPVEKHKRMSLEAFQRYWRNPGFLEQRRSEFLPLAETINALYDQVSYVFVEASTTKHLQQLLEKTVEIVWMFNAALKHTIYFDQELCQKAIGSTISERAWDVHVESFEQRRAGYLEKLKQQHLNWMEIAERCQYFGANYNEVQSLQQIEEMLKQYPSAETKSYKLPRYHGDELKLAQYIQEISAWRDIRKDYVAKGIVIIYRIAERLFREARIDQSLIFFAVADEIARGPDFLRSLHLERRRNGVAALRTYHDSLRVEICDFEPLKQQLEQYYLSKHDGTLTGQVGSTGKAQGVVQIVRNVRTEAAKFREGDILVTGMTRPEFLPLMQKAAAFITDEGGITCHAAIVAREMKKPCIIGTKVATHLLKDGDRVEVDAVKGIVRKI